VRPWESKAKAKGKERKRQQEDEKDRERERERGGGEKVTYYDPRERGGQLAPKAGAHVDAKAAREGLIL